MMQPEMSFILISFVLLTKGADNALSKRVEDRLRPPAAASGGAGFAGRRERKNDARVSALLTSGEIGGAARPRGASAPHGILASQRENFVSGKDQNVGPLVDPAAQRIGAVQRVAMRGRATSRPFLACSG